MQPFPIFGVVEVVVPHISEPVIVEPHVSEPVVEHPITPPVCVSCITAASSHSTSSTNTSNSNQPDTGDATLVGLVFVFAFVVGLTWLFRD